MGSAETRYRKKRGYSISLPRVVAKQGAGSGETQQPAKNIDPTRGAHNFLVTCDGGGEVFRKW